MCLRHSGTNAEHRALVDALRLRLAARSESDAATVVGHPTESRIDIRIQAAAARRQR